MLGTKIILQFILDNLVNLISFVSTIILARAGGPEVLGLIGFVLAILGMMSFIGDLGLSQVHIKQVAGGYNLGYAAGVFYLLKLFLVFLILIFSLIYFFFSDKVEVLGINYNYQLFFVALLFGFLFAYFGQALLLTFQARKEVIKYNIVLFFGRIAKLIVILFAAVISFKLSTVAAAYFFEGIIILAGAVFLLRKYPVKFPRRQDIKTYLILTMPFILWVPLANFSGNIDRLILKNFWGLAEVGLFFAIQTFIILPQSLSTAAMNLFFFPQVSELTSSKQTDKLQDYTNAVVRYLNLVTIPLVILIIVFAKPLIILVLGNEFEEAFRILQIFSFAILVLTISRPYSYVLLGSDYQKIVPIVNFFLLLIIFLLELIFIPKELFGLALFGLGAKGAALASLVAWSVGLIIFAIYANKLLKVKFYYSIYKHLIAGGAMFGVLYFLFSENLQFFSIYNILFGILSLLIFQYSYHRFV